MFLVAKWIFHLFISRSYPNVPEGRIYEKPPSFTSSPNSPAKKLSLTIADSDNDSITPTNLDESIGLCSITDNEISTAEFSSKNATDNGVRIMTLQPVGQSPVRKVSRHPPPDLVSSASDYRIPANGNPINNSILNANPDINKSSTTLNDVSSIKLEEENLTVEVFDESYSETTHRENNYSVCNSSSGSMLIENSTKNSINEQNESINSNDISTESRRLSNEEISHRNDSRSSNDNRNSYYEKLNRNPTSDTTYETCNSINRDFDRSQSSNNTAYENRELDRSQSSSNTTYENRELDRSQSSSNTTYENLSALSSSLGSSPRRSSDHYASLRVRRPSPNRRPSFFRAIHGSPTPSYTPPPPSGNHVDAVQLFQVRCGLPPLQKWPISYKFYRITKFWFSISGSRDFWDKNVFS